MGARYPRRLVDLVLVRVLARVMPGAFLPGEGIAWGTMRE